MSFRFQIELLVPIKPENSEPIYLKVWQFYSDPGFRVGDEIKITDWEIWDKTYTFSAKVVQIQNQVVPHPNSRIRQTYKIDEESAKDGLLLRRCFVESEERDIIVEIAERIRRNQ
jgi:hypothetical protein